MAATPLRNVRVPDDLWDAARRRAKIDRMTVSSAVLAMLVTYTQAVHHCGHPYADHDDGGRCPA